MNLEKVLIKQNVKSFRSGRELLLLNEYNKHKELADNQILDRLGLNENVKQGAKVSKETESRLLDTKSFDQNRVFHISQIESISKKYYLKFLPIDIYKGDIDKELPNKIAQFELAHGVTLTKTKRENGRLIECNSFIVAPRSSFNLQTIPKDPLFFYKINEEYYYLIHKWGNDLSIFRRILPLLSSWWFSNIVVFALILNTFLIILDKNAEYKKLHETTMDRDLYLGLGVLCVMAFIVQLLWNLTTTDRVVSRGLRFMPLNIWNSDRVDS